MHSATLSDSRLCNIWALDGHLLDLFEDTSHRHDWYLPSLDSSTICQYTARLRRSTSAGVCNYSRVIPYDHHRGFRVHNPVFTASFHVCLETLYFGKMVQKHEHTEYEWWPYPLFCLCFTYQDTLLQHRPEWPWRGGNTGNQKPRRWVRLFFQYDGPATFQDLLVHRSLLFAEVWRTKVFRMVHILS